MSLDPTARGDRSLSLACFFVALCGAGLLPLVVLAPCVARAQQTGWLKGYQAAHRDYKARRYGAALRGFTRVYSSCPTSRKPAIAVMAATSAAHTGDLDAYLTWVPRAGKKLSSAARKKLSTLVKEKVTAGGPSASAGRKTGNRPKKRRAKKSSPIPVKWIRLRGGKYEMGAAEDDLVHDVKVPSFRMMKAEVTQGQFRACVDSGRCSPTKCSSSAKKRGIEGFLGKDHPVVCVKWSQARAFCRWIGGRLPTEAEWEFAAKSRGKAKKYAWGFARADCTRAVMKAGGRGCGKKTTWPVCSRTAGNTEQGLCDMSGNADEWVEDCWHVALRNRETFEGAPTDGSAWTKKCKRGVTFGRVRRVLRGGSFTGGEQAMRTTYRYSYYGENVLIDVGFRCAR